MPQSGRGSRWLSILMVIIAFLALVRFQGGQRALLSRCTAVYPRAPTFYQWISDHELLLFKPASADQRGNGWTLVRGDLSTGIETPLKAAATGFPRRSDAPTCAAISPDGRWLLWRDKTKIVVARLDGTLRRTWDDSANWHAELNPGLPHWQNDSRHFAELLTRHVDNLYSTPYYGAVDIRGVEAPDDERIVAIPRRTEFESSYLEPPHPTSDDKVFAASDETSGTKTMLFVSLKADKPIRKLAIHAPTGTEFISRPSDNYTSVALSPRGDRVAWLCVSPPHAPPLQELLHWMLPRVNTRTQRTFSIWISRVDGADMLELGEIETNEDDKDTFRSGVSNVVWLPSGGYLGFAYNNTVYRVPVN